MRTCAKAQVRVSFGVDRVRRHLLISGRVHNVWFRDGCAEQARAHGVDGWVRNLPDGRVEAVLEGPPGAVATVEAWCSRGPRRARVDRVEGRDELAGAEVGFSVR
jgi:acylphosphatase